MSVIAIFHQPADSFRVADHSTTDALAVLLPQLSSLNITSDLIQVRKVVTGHQS